MDEKPPDWDWVTAVNACQATVMFGTIKALAKQNVETRNKQVGSERFRFHEENGITFSVNRPSTGDVFANMVTFKVTDDLRRIAVSFGRGLNQSAIEYEVGLDDNGDCALKHEGGIFDPWHALRDALQPLLFGK